MIAGQVTRKGWGAARRTLWVKRLLHIWVTAAVVLVVSICGTAAQPKSAETAAQKTILFLHSFGPNFQPFATWSREIIRELNRQSPWPLDIQEQSLITARGADDPSEAKFVEYLKAHYAQRPPDLIVAEWCACRSLLPAKQGRPVSDNADAARGARRASG